jgi:hypothetical protein
MSLQKNDIWSRIQKICIMYGAKCFETFILHQHELRLITLNMPACIWTQILFSEATDILRNQLPTTEFYYVNYTPSIASGNTPMYKPRDLTHCWQNISYYMHYSLSRNERQAAIPSAAIATLHWRTCGQHLLQAFLHDEPACLPDATKKKPHIKTSYPTTF